jgi:Ca2+-binding RTX toxin-like protein
VTYARRVAAVAADPDGVAGDDGEAGERDTINTDVENLLGGAGADTLTGNGAANLLRGGPGGDRLSGRAGTDRLDGEAGYDRLDGGTNTTTGKDVCVAGADGAQVRGCEVVS